jgi:TusA-related sulfurtransferase
VVDLVIDARNLPCPEPVIKVDRESNGIAAGQTIEVIATDRGSIVDIPAWAMDRGYVLAEEYEQDGEFHFIIRTR